MKKLLTPVAIVLIGLAMTLSCSKKDEATPALAGSWKFTSFTASNCTDPNDNGTDTCTGTATECGVITFTATTWSYAQTIAGIPPIAESGTYSLSGSSITLSGGTNITGTYTYSVSGSTMTITETNSSNGCTEVISFTKV